MYAWWGVEVEADIFMVVRRAAEYAVGAVAERLRKGIVTIVCWRGGAVRVVAVGEGGRGVVGSAGLPIWLGGCLPVNAAVADVGDDGLALRADFGDDESGSCRRSGVAEVEFAVEDGVYVKQHLLESGRSGCRRPGLQQLCEVFADFAAIGMSAHTVHHGKAPPSLGFCPAYVGGRRLVPEIVAASVGLADEVVVLIFFARAACGCEGIVECVVIHDICGRVTW